MIRSVILKLSLTITCLVALMPDSNAAPFDREFYDLMRQHRDIEYAAGKMLRSEQQDDVSDILLLCVEKNPLTQSTATFIQLLRKGRNLEKSNLCQKNDGRYLEFPDGVRLESIGYRDWKLVNPVEDRLRDYGFSCVKNGEWCNPWATCDQPFPTFVIFRPDAILVVNTERGQYDIIKRFLKTDSNHRGR